MNTVPIHVYTSKSRGRGINFRRSFRDRRSGLTGNMLKTLGMLFMLLDHVGVALIERGILQSGDPAALQQILLTDSGRFWWQVDRVLRYTGRLAFPFFAFLLVEGFLHTRHQKEYGLRLLAFAVLSELPFDLAIFGELFHWDYQNVIWTLFIAYLVMLGLKKFNRNLFLQLLCTAAGCGVAYVIRSDYGAVGVLTIVLLYWFRDTGLQKPIGLVMAGLDSMDYWCVAALAYLPIWFYNEQRGEERWKYVFYVFYPAHLLILFGIRQFFL